MNACADQLKEILEGLNALLIENNTTIKDVCYIHLLLDRMSLFTSANKEYSSWFGMNPPSRSCIEVINYDFTKI